MMKKIIYLLIFIIFSLIGGTFGGIHTQVSSDIQSENNTIKIISGCHDSGLSQESGESSLPCIVQCFLEKSGTSSLYAIKKNIIQNDWYIVKISQNKPFESFFTSISPTNLFSNRQSYQYIYYSVGYHTLTGIVKSTT